MKKTIINWIGRILMILSIIVIATKVWEYHESLEITLTAGMIIQMSICCLLYAVVVYMCPFIYKNTLYITTGKKISYIKVADTYCKSNIMKYLPGNVMQYIGRNEIALKEELPHGEVALATVLEIVTTLVSSVFVATLFSWKYVVEWITNFVDIDVKTVLLMIIMGATCGVVILSVLWKKIQNYIKTVVTIRNALRFLGLTIYASVIMILNSLIYYYTLSLLGIKMQTHYYMVGVGLYSLAFVLGYVTPGVPGGIGIREAVMVYFFSALMKESDVLTGALIFRVISIIGDFIGFGVAVIIREIYKTGFAKGNA